MLTTVPLHSSANGRLSGKPWKLQSAPRPHRLVSWHARIAKAHADKSLKLLHAQLSQEKQADRQRANQAAKQRRQAADERKRLEEAKAHMGARKAARLRRKAGKTKKINH